MSFTDLCTTHRPKQTGNFGLTAVIENDAADTCNYVRLRSCPLIFRSWLSWMGRLRHPRLELSFSCCLLAPALLDLSLDFSALLVVICHHWLTWTCATLHYTKKVSRRTPQPWVSGTTQQHVPRLTLSRICFMLPPPPFAVLAPIFDDGTHKRLAKMPKLPVFCSK